MIWYSVVWPGSKLELSYFPLLSYSVLRPKQLRCIFYDNFFYTFSKLVGV